MFHYLTQTTTKKIFLGWLKGIFSSGVGGVDDDLNCEISFSQPRNEKQQFYHGDDNVVVDGSFNEPLRLFIDVVDGGNVMTLYAIVVVVVDDQQRIRNSKMGNKHTQSEK